MLICVQCKVAGSKICASVQLHTSKIY